MAESTDARGSEASAGPHLKRSHTLMTSPPSHLRTNLRSTTSIRHRRALSLLSPISHIELLPLERPASPASITSIPSQEQFFDGRATPTLNGQPPAILRTFRRSLSSLSQYEAENTPNMAFIDREMMRAQSRASNDSISEAGPHLLNDISDREEADDHSSTSNSRDLASIITNATVCSASERAQERSIAEMLSSGSRGRARTYHGRHPARDFRKAPLLPPPFSVMKAGPICSVPEVVRSTEQTISRHNSRSARIEYYDIAADIASEDSGFLERQRRFINTPALASTPEDGSPVRFPRPPRLYVVNPDRPSSSFETESSAVTTLHTRHAFTEPGDYFGDSISAEVQLREDVDTQDRAPSRTTLRTTLPRLHITSDPTIHPAYRRHTVSPPNTSYPLPLERLPSLSTNDVLDSAGTNLTRLRSQHRDSRSLALPRPSTHSKRHPNRWYIVLYNYIRQQPSHYPPNQFGAEYIANLEHNIAPSHWLLRWLQIVIWMAILIVCAIRIVHVTARTGGRLPFECYELVTELGLRRPHLLRREKDNQVMTSIARDVRTGKYFDKKAVCELVPLNGAVFLADDFVMLMLLGVTACGLALLLQALWLKVWKKALKWSGAYGTVTLIVCVVGQVVSWFLGVVLVVGIAWGSARTV